MEKLVLMLAMLAVSIQAYAHDVEIGLDYITINKSKITQIEAFDAAPGFIYDLRMVITTTDVDANAWSTFVAQKNNTAVAVSDKFIVGTDTVKIARSLINGIVKSSKSIALTSLSFKPDALQIKDEIKSTSLLPIYKGQDGITKNIGMWYAPNYALYWNFRK